MRLPRSSLFALALAGAACRSGSPPPGGSYIVAWAAGADSASDFLAVIGADPLRADYARVVATLPVGQRGTVPHHTEYEMPAGGVLWANGFAAGVTFRFDLRDPRHPKLAGRFGDRAGYADPHSFARLPDGRVLATFQRRAGPGPAVTGGLVELDSTGEVVRAASAASPADSAIRPYSLAVLPELDRVVTTATDMSPPLQSRAVQVWRLSDLVLLQTLLLPPGPRGDEQWLTAEPRALPDGTVFVSTFTCGLYRLTGLDRDTARAGWVYSSTGGPEPPYCAVPVLAGRYWLVPSGPERAVVVLDVSDPSRPTEASRLRLGPDEVPHWLALDRSGSRVVITGYRQLKSRILLARLDPGTGALTLDSAFTSPGAARPGVDLGGAVPHGTLFTRE